uniref:DUF192 domain-containing protein n=1 Tax=Petrachloros mirabilis TaxID=2918835 RepID=UPI0030846562
MRWRLFWGVCLGLGVLGCEAPSQTLSPTPTAQASSAASESGQSLPVSAIVKLPQTAIELEVARTQEEQAMGLMFRADLADDRGMLFPFDPPQSVNFWMRNVKIPLDMVFLREGRIVAIAANVPPCRQPVCPTYGPSELVDQVIELRGGRAAELDLAVGETLMVQFLENSFNSSTPAIADE